MAGRRIALVIATDDYTDSTFQRLYAPAEDARSLAKILSTAAEYSYETTVLYNAPAALINRAIEQTLVDARKDDVFLLYFSGHGVRDDSGGLYLAAVDSEHLLPGSTMVAAQFVRAQLDRSYCGQKIVLLDCCFGGAFPRGHLPKGSQRAEVLHQLAGRGCAVLTASTALEYAYEPCGDDNPSIGAARRRSYYTSALINGLHTGAADLNGDGWVDSDELYRYVADELSTTSPGQNPSYECKLSGHIVVAANPRGPRLGYGLPDDLALALRSSLVGVRVAATHCLSDLAKQDKHGNRVLSGHARAALRQLERDDDAAVRAAATTSLAPPQGNRSKLWSPWPTAGRHAEAVEQADRRAEELEYVGALFVNLARRSQVLVERQLSLIDRLERDEQDPEQLGNLFELDHIATRMRRNSENLLVLSGSGLAKPFNRPAPIGDLIGAAVAEIEQYARIGVSPSPNIQILGQAVNELVRLIAELLDNATLFSEPSSKVSVRIAKTRSHGVAVQITDRGVGMSEDEVCEANERFVNPPELDVTVSRRMGLFVVGRLAARNGIRVRLQLNSDIQGGITALVVIPANLCVIPEPMDGRS